MSYIQNEKHFIRYLEKVVRNHRDEIDKSRLLAKSFYVKEIYDVGLADRFTWALKQGAISLLESDNVLDWLAQQNQTYIKDYEFGHKLTQRFLDLAADLETYPGIYCFQTREGKPLYIGRSIRLGRRMIGSFTGRFDAYDRPIFVKYIVTDTAVDASVLEPYFIAALNPPYNRKNNYTEACSLTIAPLPEWSESIQCNVVEYKEEESDGQKAL